MQKRADKDLTECGMLIVFCRQKDVPVARKIKPRGSFTVDGDLQINLACVPWPASVLKFSQIVTRLRAGDKLIARLDDPDVAASLQLFLSNQQDLHFAVSHTDADYCIRVIRR